MSRSLADITAAPVAGEKSFFTVSARDDASTVAESVEQLGGNVINKGRFNQLDIRLEETEVGKLKSMDAVEAISAEGPLRFAEESFEGN